MEITRREIFKYGIAAALTPSMLLGADVEPKKGPYDDAVLMPNEPPSLTSGAFTVAVLPDTQHYSEKFPETYMAQTRWIIENQKARNIACVLHLGDITNNNKPVEWENASKAMQLLDGNVPYFLVPGNHDYSTGGQCVDRTTLLNNYFPLARLKEAETFGGVYDQEPDRLENSFHLFSAEGREFLVLGLEFGPRKDVIRWANDVVSRHPTRAVILITHAYIYNDDTRYNWKKYGAKQSWNPHTYAVAKATGNDVSDGEEIWTELISRHHNFILTLNGHVLGDGLGKVRTATPDGREIQQMLVNFQMRPKGGDGWLRLMEFHSDGKTVQVYDYSPTRNERNASAQNEFSFQTAAPIV